MSKPSLNMICRRAWRAWLAVTAFFSALGASLYAFAATRTDSHHAVSRGCPRRRCDFGRAGSPQVVDEHLGYEELRHRDHPAEDQPRPVPTLALAPEHIRDFAHVGEPDAELKQGREEQTCPPAHQVSEICVDLDQWVVDVRSRRQRSRQQLVLVPRCQPSRDSHHREHGERGGGKPGLSARHPNGFSHFTPPGSRPFGLPAGRQRILTPKEADATASRQIKTSLSSSAC